MNSKNTQIPSGKRYNVYLTKSDKNYLFVLYAADKEDAIRNAEEAWSGTGWEITKVEEA